MASILLLVLVAGIGWAPPVQAGQPGDTWVSHGPPQGVDAIAIDPSHPAILYAGAGGGVFKSTNAGDWWYSSSKGIVADSKIRIFAIDDTDCRVVYAGGDTT